MKCPICKEDKGFLFRSHFAKHTHYQLQVALWFELYQKEGFRDKIPENYTEHETDFVTIP